ncbi:MAG: hypothetical protein QNK05_00390 [Myxococcota bacterium]|nr:hypothetical protein [Myxococcota bacterium]
MSALASLLLVQTAHARTETLRWLQASASEVSGFEILVGTRSGDYSQVIDAGKPPTTGGAFRYDVEVGDEDVYVAVRAYSADGLRSPVSNERFRAGPGGSGSGSGGSGSGSGGSGNGGSGSGSGGSGNGGSGSGSGGSGSGGSGSGSGGSGNGGSGSGSGGSGNGGSGSGSGGSGGGEPEDFRALPDDSGFPRPRAALAEDFESKPLGSSVSGWVDTRSGNRLARNDALFGVEEHSGNRVLVTDSEKSGVHSHYLADGSAGWSDYVFTGAFAIDDPDGVVGVTALSQFDDSAAYYGLRRAASGSLEIDMGPGVSCNDPRTGVTPRADRWYRFRMSLDIVKSGVRVRARVWRAGRSEPSGYQAVCIDSSASALRSGTIGVTSAGPGKKYWDELQVVPRTNSTSTPDGGPGLVLPKPGSALGDSSVTFQWADPSGKTTDWWLNLGTSQGGYDLWNSGRLGAVNSLVVSGLPTTGQPLYARLWFRAGSGDWESIDYTFTAADVGTPLIFPFPGSRLGASQTFSWTDPGGLVTDWWLNLGTTLGGYDVLNSGNLGGQTTISVDSLPTAGETLHARLWSRAAGADWQSRDYTFQATDLAPTIVAPAPGTELGAAATFSWKDPTGQVSDWWLNLGTSPGSYDVLSSGNLGTFTEIRVSDLPTTGGTIHARLWYRIGSTWRSRDYTYTTLAPKLTSPAPGATLPGSAVTFRWSRPIDGVQDWWLNVGTSPGAYDLVSSGRLGAGVRSLRVDGLPTDGRTLHVRLWFELADGWHSRDVLFTAAP